MCTPHHAAVVMSASEPVINVNVAVASVTLLFISVAIKEEKPSEAKFFYIMQEAIFF